MRLWSVLTAPSYKSGHTNLLARLHRRLREFGLPVQPGDLGGRSEEHGTVGSAVKRTAPRPAMKMVHDRRAFYDSLRRRYYLPAVSERAL